MTNNTIDETSFEARSNFQKIKTEYINCPLCTNDDYDSLFRGRDRLHGLEGEFNVVKCRSCNLVYLNPIPIPEQMGYYYPQDYQPYSGSEEKSHGDPVKLEHLILETYYGYPNDTLIGGSRLWRKILLFPLYLKFRTDRKSIRILPFIGDGKLLDVGCGSGRFLSFAQRHGWDAQGIDTSPQAVDYARSIGLNVVLGDLIEAGFEDNRFNVVRMWHVLEHLYDPVAELKEVCRILKDSGMLVIAVPNIESFVARHFQERWFHLDVPRHLCSFSRRTIERILTKSGFMVISIKYDRGASGLKGSLRYLAKDGKSLAAKLVKRKYLLRFFNLILALLHQGDVIVVYAKKKL